MPKMPLVDTTPKDEQAIEGYTNGHVVDPTQPQKQMVVVTVEDTEATKNVSKNLDVINRVSNNLLAIANVDKNISKVNKLIDLKDEIVSVLDVKESIRRLAVISNELDTLALNIHAIQEISNNLDTLIALGNDQEEYHFLWDIREHIVGLNESKDKLLMLLANMDNIDINARGIADIKLVALHMLAVEIVAQNIDLLRFFNNHTELFEKTVEMYPALQEFLKYVDIAQELVDIVTNLPETLEQFKGDMNNLANEMTEKFKALADDRLEQMERAYDKFMSESLRLRESILDVDKALTDFKLKSMDEYTVLREGIAKFKEDLAKSQEQIQGDINEVEKNTILAISKIKDNLEDALSTHEKEAFKRISHMELNFSNAIEIVKKDNAEFKLEIVKQLEDQEDKDETAFKELENVLNSKISTNRDLIANLKDYVNEVKDGFEIRVDNTKDNFENRFNVLTENMGNFTIEVNNKIIDIKEQILDKLLEDGANGLDLATLIAEVKIQLNADVELLKESTQRLENNITTNAESIDTLKTNVATNKSNIAAITTTFNSFKNTTETFKNNTTNTLTTVQEDIRQLKAKPTTVVQESTWEII